MADEAGMPFYSTNGAEYVDLYSGVAAGRIRSLFAKARENKASGSIIFIDEIDAIGLARKTSGGDAASTEREQGLLQLLTEMDGFYEEANYIVIAATNRVDVLDKALLRPGRFDRIIQMDNPSKKYRTSVLKVHSRGKKFCDLSSVEETLEKTSSITDGYSGAELANVLNEASILSVRNGKAGIDIPTIFEAVSKVKLGLLGKSLPKNEAKRRFLESQAAKVVAIALNPRFTADSKSNYKSIVWLDVSNHE
jgi:cell division protease FtsH